MAGNVTPNIPDYPGGQPWYLSSINHALYIDETSGNVCVRTGFQGNIIIEGNVNIPGSVDAHISEIGTSGPLTVPWMPVSIDGNANVNATVTGNVVVTSLPAINGNVVVTGGNINAAVTGNVGVNGLVNIGIMPPIAGNVTVIGGNINAAVTGNVNAIVSGNVGVTGNVNIGTMPAITGNVNASVSGNVTVNSITANLPGITGNVTVVDGGGSITVDGNVGITGGNVNAAVSGNVGINSITANLPGITGNVTVVDGGGSITIDGNVGIIGNVNIGTMPEVEIKNDVGNPISVSKNGNTNSQTNPIYVEGVNNASFFAPTQSDAFGRLRVSNPMTLFDSQNKYTDQGQFASRTIGGGSVTYNQPSNTFNLAVTGAGSSVSRETTKTFIYQPGKSLFILNTFAMNTPTPGLTQSLGYYNDDNGIYFEADGTTLNMVIRSSSSGSTVETVVPQSLWNGDRLDGTGLSGITLNPALAQIFWMDIEWLGVGSVRTGFVIGGQLIVCHTFNHANIPGNVTTYMGTAVLPIRYEISSTGPAGSMRQICSTVISEGGYTPSGIPGGRGHDLGSPVRLPNDLSFKPLMAIRLKSSQPDAVVIPVDFTIVPVDQAVVKYRVYARAVTSGGSWISAGASSSVEYNLAPTAITSGNHTVSGFLISNNQSINTPQNEVFDFTDQLSRNPFTSTMYEYVLEAATTGTNIDVYASINWQEIT